MGVPMGAPHFEWREAFERAGVHALSSNFTLYRDMSRRVMEVIRSFSPDVEVYSVDEAFIQFKTPPSDEELMRMRWKILQWTGIPVSIGLSKTKTLAKAANHLAKKGNGILSLRTAEEIEEALRKFPLEDLWGIGRRLSLKLKRRGLLSAWDLRTATLPSIRKEFNVVLLRLIEELKGHPCLTLETEPPSNQTLLSSRSFGEPIADLDSLQVAVANHIDIATKKLREMELKATYLMVFLIENRRVENRYPTMQRALTLTTPSSYTPELTSHAKELTEALFQTGKTYRKAGIFFDGLVPEKTIQGDLFGENLDAVEKKEQIMQVVDEIQKKWGKKSVQFAGQFSLKEEWRVKKNYSSPHYTTSWNELLKVKV